MAKLQLDKDKDFVVRESAGLNFIIAACCWGALIVIAVSYSTATSSLEKWVYLAGAVVALSVGVMFTAKAVRRKECIRINRSGFFYYRKFITDWQSLDSAQVTQDDKMFTIQDNFVLILRYSKESGEYLRKISLTNTQDKSEEDILAAIKFFSGKTVRLE